MVEINTFFFFVLGYRVSEGFAISECERATYVRKGKHGCNVSDRLRFGNYIFQSKCRPMATP